MRLLALDMRSFGGFAEERIELAPGTSVLVGPNEAGKSTFLCAVETLLYGFEPANRDKHPLAHPTGNVPLVRGTFELASGDELTVERRLGSKPTLTLERRAAAAGPDSEAQRSSREPNRPLREAEGTPRSLYRSIYALDSTQLVELDSDVRAAVDELLLGEPAVPGLRPVHRVREELRSRRKELWRTDNRGKPRARRLRQELNEARKAYHAARTAEDGLREGLVEEARLRRELEELRVAKRDLERKRADAAFRAEACELDARRTAQGRADLTGLAGDPLVDPADLERELRDLTEVLQEQEARVTAGVELTSTHKRILERAGAIEAARTARGRYEGRQEAVEEARDRMRHAEAEALAAWGRLAGGQPQRSQLSPLRTFPLESLRAELTAWEERRGSGDENGSPVAWLAGLVGCAIVVATSLDWIAPPFVALGLTFLALAWFELRVRGRDRSRRTPDRVAAQLSRLGLAPSLAATPLALARLIDQLEAVVTRLEELESAEDRTLAIARELEVQEEEWEELLEELDLGSGAPGIEAAARLEDALAHARDREERVRHDRREREQARALVEAHRPRVEALQARLERLHAVLRRNVLGEPNAQTAFRVLRERVRTLEYLDSRLHELRSDPRWGRLVEGRDLAELASESDDEGVDEACAAELTTVEERVAAIHHRLGGLATERRDSPSGRVARAREAVAQLEAALEATHREHDRLALAEAVLAEADRRWREAHQPDVLRRASTYLEAITAERYARLDYPAGTEGGLVVYDSEGESWPADAPLSRGTRDQIYLALRLGLLDHLDEGRAALPLVLDEALVHWDAPRRAALYPLLARVARHRQVLVTTCHPAFADEAAAALGVDPIRLAPAHARA